MAIFKSLFKSRDRPRNYSGDTVGGGRVFPFGRTWAGKPVTERSAMQLTPVYACVRIIAETVASLPLHVYEYTENGKEKVYDHPLYRVLHDIPNPEMNSFIMREVMMNHLLLWGNSYSQIIQKGKGEVTEPYPILPGIKTADVETIGDWIISQRDAKKTFKAVLPCSVSDYSPNNEGIVDFATEDIKCGSYSYTTAEYCARIAGLLAGLSIDESATYQVLDDISSIKESTTPDADIDGGKFIIINDGEKFKVGMGINSLHILSDDKTEDMKKIKIIEGMDLIRDDIA